MNVLNVVQSETNLNHSSERKSTTVEKLQYKSQLIVKVNTLSMVGSLPHNRYNWDFEHKAKTEPK